MQIGILSDSHDNTHGIELALYLFRDSGVRFVLHGGDWVSPATVEFADRLAGKLGLTLGGVLGNNDRELEARLRAGDLELPNTEIALGPVWQTEQGGRRIAVCHGHIPGVFKRLIDEGGWDLIVRGHSHRAGIRNQGTTLVVNPGAVSFSIPRKAGFVRTVALYDSESNTAGLEQVA